VSERGSDEGRSRDELLALASCHRRCLPHTASSRAGVDVVVALYSTLERDDASRVVWVAAASGGDLGAFCSGTVDLRRTERRVVDGLSATQYVRLGLRSLSAVSHLVARRAWERTIPKQGVGYVLTLGTSSSFEARSGALPGKSVLAELERWFVSKGVSESWVDTECANERALEFYRKRGYREVRRTFGHALLCKSLAGAVGADGP
jgi:ribosomal protein S18 acetylase RimI-like enzyme